MNLNHKKMNNIPYWLEIVIYFVMAGLCATVFKFIFQIYKIIKNEQ